MLLVLIGGGGFWPTKRCDRAKCDASCVLASSSSYASEPFRCCRARCARRGRSSRRCVSRRPVRWDFRTISACAGRWKSSCRRRGSAVIWSCRSLLLKPWAASAIGRRLLGHAAGAGQDPAVRAAAALGLRQLGDPRGRAALTAMIEGSDPRAQLRAAPSCAKAPRAKAQALLANVSKARSGADRGPHQRALLSFAGAEPKARSDARQALQALVLGGGHRLSVRRRRLA